jgi:hypothetical protein
MREVIRDAWKKLKDKKNAERCGRGLRRSAAMLGVAAIGLNYARINTNAEEFQNMKAALDKFFDDPDSLDDDDWLDIILGIDHTFQNQVITNQAIRRLY